VTARATRLGSAGRPRRAAVRRAAVAALATVLAGLGLLSVAASPASAHNTLVGTDPSADEELTEPLDQVTLTFDDVVLDLGGGEGGGGTALDVTGPDGAHHATACPSVVDRTVTAPVALGEAGTYTVTWRVVSADGHPISGRYEFDYAPPAGTPATAGTAAAACGAPADGASADAADDGASEGAEVSEAPGGSGASEEPAAAFTGPSWGITPGAAVGIAVGTAVVGAAAVLVALRLARRR
jgi:methionine-rich copper-binding protein CopC